MERCADNHTHESTVSCSKLVQKVKRVLFLIAHMVVCTVLEGLLEGIPVGWLDGVVGVLDGLEVGRMNGCLLG